jgi:hypothetical protein
MIWNIVDSRRNRYRWAKVHAIVEATWNDNSASGADQAPSPTAESEVVFDERKNISIINNVIAWANWQTCPVTLYIRDDEALPRSPSEEVDAAARILDGFARRNGWWASSTPSFDDLDPTRKSDLRFMVEGMLRAAARVRGQESA